MFRTPRKPLGFTLLELIVVIVVLGVLAAIAIPTFQAVIQRSSDEATLTSLRAMAREAQALEAFDRNGWDQTDVEAAASDTTAVAPGVYAAKLTATKDAGKDPAPGEVTYVIDGAGLALSKLSDTGRVCVVGANYSSVDDGSCGPSQATDTKSSLGVRLSDPNVETFPTGTETSAPAADTTPPATPAGLAATAGDGFADVSWSAVSDADLVSYRVYVGGVLAATVSAPATTVRLTLTNGATYSITVSAVDSSSNESVQSGAVTAAPKAATVDLVSSSWSSAPSMALTRAYAVAERGADGDIYVFGGRSSSDGTVERYDVGTSAWSSAPSMLTPRDQAASATDKLGRIYVIGGLGATTLATVERFDASTGLWEAVAPLPKPLRMHTAAAGPDGLIYVTGGFDGADYSNATYRYNPTSNTWDTLANLPITPYGASSEVDASGRFYVIGGVNGSTPSAAMYRYDPTNNTWSTLASMPAARRYHASTVDADGNILVFGGYIGDPVATVVRYDAAKGTWAEVTSLVMPEGRYQHTAVLDETGRLFVIGGITYINNTSAASSTVIRLG